MADIQFEDNRFLVSGELNFSNVMAIYKKSLSEIKQSPELVFDFSSLKSSDSAGLALIIEWIKLSRKLKKPVRFEYLSSELMSIAKAAGMDEML